MSKIIWDANGSRLFETGVKNGVLYPMQSNGQYSLGVPWNGLTSITESPSGAESTPLYADDIKYLNLMSAEEFAATIEAYTYPDEFAICDGSAELVPGVTVGQQARKVFGMCYRTTIGNDVDGNEHGYKLHIIYGCLASPSQRGYSTINDNPEAITFSWEVKTTPVNVANFKPTACMIIDSTKVNREKLAQLEDVLFGTSATDPRLPLPDEIARIIGSGVNTYTVTNYLTNVDTDNIDDSATGTYAATLSAAAGYTIRNVVVMMGGVDVTSTAYTAASHTINIASVTGAIVVFATANA